MNAQERARVRAVADKLSEAKTAAGEALAAWDTLPDVDASSGELELAIELLGRVEGDLDRAEDDW